MLNIPNPDFLATLFDALSVEENEDEQIPLRETQDLTSLSFYSDSFPSIEGIIPI